MSSEGVTLVARALLVVVLILVTAFFRVLYGPGKRRGHIMLAGGVAGMAVGVLLASAISNWFDADVSAIAACVGIVCGWAVSWKFAKSIPRNAD